MKRVVCFISPSLWRGDIKYATSFINTVWNENLFQILFITCLTHKNARKTQFYRVLLPILLRKTRQRRGVTYDVIDELRRLSLSKYFPPLCHKLIYHMILHLWSEISLFHKFNLWHSALEHFDRPRSRSSSMTSLVTSRRWRVYRSKIDKKIRFSHIFAGLTCDWKNLKWIFTSCGIYETRCVFYIPSPKARGYKSTQLVS